MFSLRTNFSLIDKSVFVGGATFALNKEVKVTDPAKRFTHNQTISNEPITKAVRSTVRPQGVWLICATYTHPRIAYIRVALPCSPFIDRRALTKEHTQELYVKYNDLHTKIYNANRYKRNRMILNSAFRKRVAYYVTITQYL